MRNANAAIDHFLRKDHENDMVDAMRYAWQSTIAPPRKLYWSMTWNPDKWEPMPEPTHALASPLFMQLLKNAMPRPSGLTYMGVPIVWDVFEDNFGLTQQEKDDMAKTTAVADMDSHFRAYFGNTVWKLPKPKKLPPYRTVGVRFIHGHNLLKVYTYRVRKAAKVHLGQEVIVENNPPSGWTKSLAVIVRIDATPQDNQGFNYLWIEQAVKPL